MAKPHNRRKRVLIDELQYRMLVVNIVYFFVILMIFLTTLFAPLVVHLLSDSGSFAARERAAQQVLLLDQTIWLPLLLTFFCLGAHSVIVSRRIVGPLHQLPRVLGAVRDGDLSVRVKLREKDYPLKEEKVINEMIQDLCGRIHDAGQQADEVRERLAWLRTSIATGSRGEVLDQIRTLETEADSLRTALAQFTTRREEATVGPVLVAANSS
jgi:methyl-accepting chemotaxis protein